MTTCAVCNGSIQEDVAQPASTYARPGAYRVGRCERCGCGQTLPRPDERELAAFYAKEYSYDAHVLIAGEKRWRARHILDLAMRADDRRVLDIGCMYGYLLEEAKARGATSAVGVELSAGPAKEARAKGLDVFTGTVEAFAEGGAGPFDLVIAQHVLEHVPDLASFLRTVRGLVAPGGRLCVCVPNFDARTRRVFKRAWGWYQVPVHLHHFGGRALEELLGQNGFEVDRAERRGGDSLMVMVTLLQSLGRGPSSESTQAPGVVGTAIVRAASTLLRPYYFLGDDELLVLARPKPDA